MRKAPHKFRGRATPTYVVMEARVGEHTELEHRGKPQRRSIAGSVTELHGDMPERKSEGGEIVWRGAGTPGPQAEDHQQVPFRTSGGKEREEERKRPDISPRAPVACT